MYREPTWFVTIEPGAFDVVHQHVFTVRQLGPPLPVVSTGGYPLDVLYATRDGWSTRRTRLATRLELVHDVVVRAHDPLLRGRPGSHMTSYDDGGRRALAAHTPDAQVSVLGTGAPDLHIPPKTSDGSTVGVIARDFLAKGGDVALDAFTRLRAARPTARLRIIATAEEAARRDLRQPGIELVAELPRAEVLADWWPGVDVLLAPTRADCGAPYAFLEALQSGTPIVTSTSPWLDDRLVPPAVSRLPLDPEAIAEGLARLLEPAALEQARSAATSLWAQSFSMDVLGAGLLRLYASAT
jgi:glycosyltransferase involved in cell wall biosynthesis